MKDFMVWLNEIATGEYGKLVPGWKGGGQGPFDEPLRATLDPLWKRNIDYQELVAKTEFNQAKAAYEKNPSDPKVQKRYAKAMADMFSTGPILPPGKPPVDEPHQDYDNYYTFAIATWLGNDREHHRALWGKNKSPEEIEQYVKRNMKRAIRKGEFEEEIDLRFVNWEEVAEDFVPED